MGSEMRFLLFASLLLVGCSPSDSFDEGRWREADLTTRSRADMVEDLLESHPLRDMHRQHVVALLGKPTPTDKWQDWDMIYVLGPDGTYFPIDHEWLVIRLDDQGKVTDYRVVSD